VPGFEASAWFGVGAPKNTPSQIIDKLNETNNAGLADPKIKARFADLGGTPLVGSPADFRKLIAEETEKWAKVVKFSGAKARQSSEAIGGEADMPRASRAPSDDYHVCSCSRKKTQP
jgi:Tripartite tricarboxylate transporter family receptor